MLSVFVGNLVLPVVSTSEVNARNKSEPRTLLCERPELIVLKANIWFTKKLLSVK